MPANKCQAKNPANCKNPKCPSKQSITTSSPTLERIRASREEDIFAAMIDEDNKRTLENYYQREVDKFYNNQP